MQGAQGSDGAESESRLGHGIVTSRGRIEVRGSSMGFAKRGISAEFAKQGDSTKVVKQDFRQDLQSSGSTRKSQSGKMEWESHWQAGDQRGNLRAEF